jgi:hypothetical protein
LKDRELLFYRFASLAMAASFGVVGLAFFVLPERTLELFNRLSPPLGLPPAPVQAGSFFPILALGYMYLVTLLAGLMFKKPGNPLFPLLLAQGKFASSILSLVFFFGRSPYLICLANAVIDGGIGALALWLFFLQKRCAASWPT